MEKLAFNERERESTFAYVYFCLVYRIFYFYSNTALMRRTPAEQASSF